MVTHTLHRGMLKVRVHMMFLGAPDRVLDALVRYVLEGDRQSSQGIGEFIDSNLHRLRASQPITGPLTTRGKVHDLMEILARVNEQYFGSSVTDVLITWGRRTQPRGKQRKAIKLGSYSSGEKLIRIHPVLDAEWVPRYFVTYIVYHELLHHLVPGQRCGNKVLLHPPEFMRREKDFRHYERALEWERKHINRLLRSA
jgi:predicted metal-dependent hydrolase